VTRRLVVTGPESTGKTTLATALAARFSAPLLREASRAYAEARLAGGHALTRHDAEPIARATLAAEDAALAAAPALVVLDTDLVSTVVYTRHYYGPAAAWVEAAARTRRGDLYLLCDVDLPWMSDGVRDRPEGRRAMHALFAETLREFGCVVAEVGGTGPARIDAAVRAVAAVGAVGAFDVAGRR
jgi:NadR type nicotinamide-nucleotide adenylyltransferase